MGVRTNIIGLVLFLGLIGGSGQVHAAPADYPTDALADYVFACMASNGQTQENLRRCSCSIDVIAAAFPYDKYVQAETILSMSQIPGDNTGAFRDSPWTKALVDELRRAQAEAEVRCF